MADYLNGLGSVTTILRDFQVNWSSNKRIEFQQSSNLLRFPGTVHEIISFSADRPAVLDLDFTLDGRDEIFDFLNFFKDRIGRVKRFWLPSPQSFFKQSQDHLSGSVVINVKKTNFKAVFKGYERIYLLMNSGDMLSFKITQVSDGPTSAEETLSIDAALDRDISANEVCNFGFLYLVRFDTDKAEMVHLNDISANVKMRSIELVREYE